MNCLNRYRFASALIWLTGWLLGPIMLLSIMLFAGQPVSGQAAGSLAAASAGLITNLTQLRRAASAEPSLVAALKLEGTVWWADAKRGTLILHDPSSAYPLELDLPCPMPKAGDRLKLEGDCAVVPTKDGIKLTSIPIVDNDGLHAAVEKAGSIHLKAGPHPIRVAWFNRTDKSELEVAYEGPELSRRKIPESALYRMPAEASAGATNLVNGLEYRCCEGVWWSMLPDLNHLTAAQSGVVSNFTLAVASRSEHVGLQFNSYLQIAREGDYTFYLKSDDGSRLYIGEPSLRVTVLGTAALPTPRPITGGPAPAEMEDYQWSEIEGTVTSVNRLHDDLEIELATAVGSMWLKVAQNSNGSFTLVPQNRIRTVGVCRSILRLDGAKVPGQCFVQSWNDIEQRYVTPDLWATYPLLRISNATSVPTFSNSPPVSHLRGQIHAAQNGLPMTLEDGSGSITLKTAETNYSTGEQVEVLGRLDKQTTNQVLECGLFRRVGGGPGESGPLPVLTTADQVNQLHAEELKRGYPVKLRGVVTSALPGDAVIVQDATRGIFVNIGRPSPLQAGDYCELEGRTVPGEFSPFINASRIERLGPGILPSPSHPAWDQLLNGSLHCQYVELEGVVTALTGSSITLLTRDGPIKVQLDAMAPALSPDYRNALVRLRGCLFATWDTVAQRVQVGNIRLMQQWVNVVQPAPVDPFTGPSKKVGDLLRFDPQAGALQRVKVSGQIVYAGKAGCFLMDGENGLRFIYAGDPTAHVCDLVEVVGFPDLTGPSPLLREAVVRRRQPAELPKPRQLDADDLVRDEYDSQLVQLDGVLLGVSKKVDEAVLEMQSDWHRFTAVVNDLSGFNASLSPGSRLRLTGVYAGQGGNRVLGRPIDSFQLLLNSGFDIRVLSRPPWWTLKHLLTVVGLLLSVLLVALVWIKLLRRQVAERTRQLEAQIGERQRVEQQRAVEHERTRMAQDLHDDLGAGLTEVNMLGSLARSSTTTADEKNKYLDQLTGVARRLVTSLDEIVWAVNPRNDSLASLASYFASYAQQFLELAAVNCGLDIAENLPRCPLNSKFRHALLLAFKEALNNIARHAGASEARLQIRVEGEDLVLAVTDNGRGLTAREPGPGADGLSNMRERITALGGRCDIQSEGQIGTTVQFRVPVPQGSP